MVSARVLRIFHGWYLPRRECNAKICLGDKDEEYLQRLLDIGMANKYRVSCNLDMFICLLHCLTFHVIFKGYVVSLSKHALY
jgi:hypothetical protein